MKSKKPTEECPPQAIKNVVQDDNWGLKSTAIPVDDPRVTDGRVNSGVAATLDSNFMRPVYDDLQSVGIQNSRTKGRE